KNCYSLCAIKEKGTFVIKGTCSAGIDYNSGTLRKEVLQQIDFGSFNYFFSNTNARSNDANNSKHFGMHKKIIKYSNLFTQCDQYLGVHNILQGFVLVTVQVSRKQINILFQR
ncbi:hypothetical protein ACJX0J_009722, partial [Zea mays]